MIDEEMQALLNTTPDAGEYLEFKDYKDKYKFYNELMNTEDFYTRVPIEYFEVNEQIPQLDYVRKKLNKQEITTTDLEQACKQFPEIFCYYMLGVHLRPYQHFAIDLMHQLNYIALCCGRRLGKSTITKIYMLWTSFFNKLSGDLTGTTWNVILQDQEIANTLYIEPIHELLEKGDKIVLKKFKGQLGEHYFTSKLVTRREKSGKVKSNQISFNVGAICRINTLPPTAKSIGREGNVIGDEVSKWKRNTKVSDEFVFFDQLIAIIKDNTKYKAIFLSTPEGQTDLFATEIFDFEGKNPSNMFKKIWFPYWVRIEPKWLEEMIRTKDTALANKRLYMFQQEYEAKFITINEAFFDNDKIAINAITDWQKSRCNLSCSLGIDWGGTQKSQTVLYVSCWDFDPTHPILPVYKKEYPVNEDVGNMDRDLAYIKNNYNIKFVVPDNKGGRWVIPKLEQMFGFSRVTPFNFTTDKRAGYELYREAIGAGRVKIPNERETLKQFTELTDQLKPYSSNGKDDIPDAAMLSAYPFLQNQPQFFKIKSV